MKVEEKAEFMEAIREVLMTEDKANATTRLMTMLQAYDQEQEKINARTPSERWMRAWALRHVAYDYYGDSSDAMRSEDEAYAYAIQAGERTHIGPYEEARDYIDSEWWDHWENITGKLGQRGEYFACSC